MSSGLAGRDVLFGGKRLCVFSFMKLTEEEIDQIAQLAGCHYGPREIAVYLGVPTKLFMKAWMEPTSAIREAYDKGVLITQAEIDMATATSAKGGNLTAAQIWAKRNQEQDFENLKTEILFNGKV